MSSELGAAVLFGLMAAFLLWAATKSGYFTFPTASWIFPIRLKNVVIVFLIYFAASWFLTMAAASFFRREILSDYVRAATFFNFFVTTAVFICIALYWRTLPESVKMGILQRPGQKFSPKADIGQALMAWILSFPLVLSLSQFFEAIVLHASGQTELPDQMAVKFLRATFEHGPSFFFAVVSIVILAPLVEETLFRGFLQSYIRRHLGSKQAILITSVCFACFHYAAGQGLGNISIIASLFVFALFLGFVYEKRGSLFASMALHSAFNTINVINLYFFGEFTTAL